jgi:hypothetical protein
MPGVIVARQILSGFAGKREVWADRLRNLDNAWDGDIREFLGARGIEPSGYEHCLGTLVSFLALSSVLHNPTPQPISW